MNRYPAAGFAWRMESPNTTTQSEVPVESRGGGIQQIPMLNDGYDGIGDTQDRSAFADDVVDKWTDMLDPDLEYDLEPVGEQSESKASEEGNEARSRQVTYTESNLAAELTTSYTPVTLPTSTAVGVSDQPFLKQRGTSVQSNDHYTRTADRLDPLAEQPVTSNGAMRNESVSVTVKPNVTPQRVAPYEERLIQKAIGDPVTVDPGTNASVITKPSVEASDGNRMTGLRGNATAFVPYRLFSEGNRTNVSLGIYGNIATHSQVQSNDHLQGMPQKTVQAVQSAGTPTHVSSSMFVLPSIEKGLGANLSGTIRNPYGTIPVQRTLNTISHLKRESLAVRPLVAMSEIENTNRYLTAAKQKILTAAKRHRKPDFVQDTHQHTAKNPSHQYTPKNPNQYASKNPIHSQEQTPTIRVDKRQNNSETRESGRQNHTSQQQHVDLYERVRNALEYTSGRGKKAEADKEDVVKERILLKQLKGVIKEYEEQNSLNMLNVVKADLNSKHPPDRPRGKEAIQQMLQGVEVPSLDELMDEQVKKQNRHTHVLSSADKKRIVQEIRQRVSNITDSKKLKKVHTQPILTQPPTTKRPEVITESQASHVHRNVSTPGLHVLSSARAPSNGSKAAINNSDPYQVGQIKPVTPEPTQSGARHAAVNQTKVPVLVSDENALNKTVSQLEMVLKNLSVVVPDHLHSFISEKEIESFVKQMYSFVDSLNETGRQQAPISAPSGQTMDEEMDFSLESVAKRLGIQLPSRISPQSRKEIDVILKEVREAKRIDRRHYLLLMLHLAPGRDHGNILAPPSSTCSVTDNMHMIVNTSAPEQTDENLSLFHRVDLEDEFGRSVEGVSPPFYTAVGAVNKII